MSLLWECTECGFQLVGSHRPTRCTACGAEAFSLVDDTRDQAEAQYESWVRHGMRTNAHWRSHAS